MKLKKDEINFRARDGELLHHLARSELRERKLELYSHERQFQLQKNSSRTLTSVASSDGKSGTRKRQAAKSEKLKAKRVKRSSSQLNTDDEDLDGNQQKPLADNSRCRWSVEEAEWLHTQISRAKPVYFDDFAKRMKELFGTDRSRDSVSAFAINHLHWKAPTPPSGAWGNNSDQSYWIVREAKKRTSWEEMVQHFSKKFRSKRTSEELRRRYEEVQRVVDLKTPESERPYWAFGHTFRQIHHSLRPSSYSPKWRADEDRFLEGYEAKDVLGKDRQGASAKVWSESHAGSC